MPSSILRRVPGLAAAGAVLALTAATPALAVPADQGPVAPRATAGASSGTGQFRTSYQPVDRSKLTPSQLRAINGHQPLDPPAGSQTPAVTVEPVSTSSGISAWLIVLIAAGTALAGVAALGGTRVATHRTLVPHGRQRVGV
ncbi:MAG TPA: hypothetical protein VLA98_00630 [Solirubrobacteraceae bacterium]|nr:hypothetical protein [Solirubrobacteraceae bacterium]